MLHGSGYKGRPGDEGSFPVTSQIILQLQSLDAAVDLMRRAEPPLFIHRSNISN